MEGDANILIDFFGLITDFLVIIFQYVWCNKIEIFGVITGLAVIALQYKAIHWFAVIGSISSALYIYIFYNAKFYADSAMSVYYLAANMYAIYVWIKLKKKHDNDNYGGITKVPKRQIPILIVICLLLIYPLYYILENYTDSPVALGDSITTTLSFVAMWLLARKNIEHWLVWVAVNVIATGLYIWKGLYPTSVLYGVYIVVSILGYINWKKKMYQLKPE